MNNRIAQCVLIVATLACSWLAMQAVHEFGHVLHAWASGGRVIRVVLRPLEISRTDVAPDPHPQFVAWGGPLWGCVLPVTPWMVGRARAWPRAWWFRFFAGFCLVANGAYLLGGAGFPVGDAERLIQTGVPAVVLGAVAAPVLVAGLCLWNGLGNRFGLGSPAALEAVDRRVAWRVLAALVVIIALECLMA